jgi:hypothetical protein
MSIRAVRLVAVVTLSGAAAACSGPEQKVVDNYFNAVRAQDNQTLSSFAAVTFSEPVESWKVLGSRDEPSSPATLPQLSGKLRDLETELAANKKAAGTYSLQHYADIDKVRELKKKNAAVPGSLAAVGAEWDKYNEKDRDLKKQVAAAKAELEKEKRAVRLSMGEVDGVEDMPGEVQTKVVDVEVVSKGQARPYTMTLRRYELKREGGPRANSRWVVHDLKPKA